MCKVYALGFRRLQWIRFKVQGVGVYVLGVSLHQDGALERNAMNDEMLKMV